MIKQAGRRATENMICEEGASTVAKPLSGSVPNLDTRISGVVSHAGTGGDIGKSSRHALGPGPTAVKQ